MDKVTDQYLIQLEREEGGYSDSSPLDGVSTGIAEPQFTLRRIAHVGQLLVRLAGSAVLFVLAAQSGYWPAWVIAVVSLLSTRDARDRDQIIAEPVGILEPKARWSSHALLVLACAALGLWSQAAVLVLVLFLAELLSVLGEWAQATGARFHGPAVARAGNEFRRIPTLGLRYLAWLRGQRWIWSAGVALIATFSLFSTLSTFWPILALLLYAIVRRRWFVAAASVVVVFFFTGASPRVALAFVVVVVIIAMIGLIVVLVSERQPRAPVPFAAVELRGGLRAAIRYFRAHRLLANDQPDAAANLLRRAPAPTPGEVALLAWSARSTGDPAGAKRWAECSRMTGCSLDCSSRPTPRPWSAIWLLRNSRSRDGDKRRNLVRSRHRWLRSSSSRQAGWIQPSAAGSRSPESWWLICRLGCRPTTWSQ
ncbi:MAG: hypothetical protein U1E32_04420 [Rhodoglobus sp.]|nr:hypothetical protein [Rhodoglobus sp.]